MWLPVLYVFGFLAACCQLSLCANNTLDNVALLSLIPKNAEHLQALNHLAEHDDQVDVLRRSRDYNDPFDLLVPPHKIDFFKDFSDMHGVDFVVRDPQYGRKLQESQRSDLSRSGRRFSGYHPFAYSSYEDMDDFLERLQASNSDLVKLQPLGNSYEGRRLKLVRISTDHSAGNPVIFVDAGIHAREWVAPAMAMYLIYRLTQEKQSRRELDGVDWYILPLVNPDGYEYTRQSPSNRLWRKTRSKNGYCYGVDGNRNYGFRWGVSGVSTNPCNKETYAGPQPFSEPETQIVRNVMMQNADRIKIYVSLHAYGQYLVYPWGYTGESLPKEWKRLDTLARSVSAAVVQAGGKPFKVLSAGKWYAAAGGSDDFAFGAVGIPYSYTMELTDGYEFQYPQKYLRTVLPQYYEGFRVIGNQIKAEFGKQKIKQDQGMESIASDSYQTPVLYY